jgi:predicted kinase
MIETVAGGVRRGRVQRLAALQVGQGRRRIDDLQAPNCGRSCQGPQEQAAGRAPRPFAGAVDKPFAASLDSPPFRDPGVPVNEKRPDTRLVIVDGLAGTRRAALAQALVQQLRAAALSCTHHHVAARGHPLRRAWCAEEYADTAAYAAVLQQQWRNFATRAAMEDGIHVMDRVLLEPALRLQAEAGLERTEARDLAVSLFEALDPLNPVLVYLWQPPQGVGPDGMDPAAATALADEVFATLERHRILINVARTPAEGVLGDALAALGLSPRRIELSAALGTRLVGRYAGETGTPALALLQENGRLRVRGVPTLDPATARDLYPGVDGTLMVEGVDLVLTPSLDRQHALRGLMTETTDARLAALPPFLPRMAD